MSSAIKLLSFFISFLISNIESSAQFQSNQTNQFKNSARIKRQIIELENTFGHATVKKDIVRLKEIISDDFVGIVSSGAVMTKAQIIGEIEDGTNDIQVDSAANMEVRLFGNVAVVNGKLFMQGKMNGNPYKGVVSFTDVWVLRSKKWQVVNFQETKLQQE